MMFTQNNEFVFLCKCMTPYIHHIEKYMFCAVGGN